MFIDALTRVSNGQQVTADAVSTDSLNLLNTTPKRKFGTGEPVGFAVVITAAGTNSGSLDVQVISSAAAALSSPTVHSLLRLATADLAAGKAFFVEIPDGTPNLQYLGLNYDVTGTVDVTVQAWVTTRSMFSKATPESYAKGYTIS